ncbi:MAG: DUF2267 domain-containing protein [Myxococcota bacterium]
MDTGEKEKEERYERFVGEVEESGTIPSEISAQNALSGVICTLTRRVSRGQARDYAGSMPPVLKSVLSPCVMHRDEKGEKFDLQGFLQRVAEHLNVTGQQAESISRAVFRALHKHLPSHEVDDLESQLPPDLAELWRNP